MRELDAKLPLFMILALRSRSEELVEESRSAAAATAAAAAAADAGGGGGMAGGWLFERLFRGWRRREGSEGGAGGSGGEAETRCTDVAGVELAVSEKELREFCFAGRQDGGGEPLADLRGDGAADPRSCVCVRLWGMCVGCYVYEGGDMFMN